jgi:hypothetical protein
MTYAYDLINLDLMLPGVEGAAILRKLRAVKKPTPNRCAGHRDYRSTLRACGEARSWHFCPRDAVSRSRGSDPGDRLRASSNTRAQLSLASAGPQRRKNRE